MSSVCFGGIGSNQVDSGFKYLYRACTNLELHLMLGNCFYF